MRLLLKKYANIALIIIIVLIMLSPLYQLFLVRLGVYTVNLCTFYFYRLIGKLTDFFHLQEFIYHNQPFTFTVWYSPHNSSLRLTTSKTAPLWINLNIDGTPVVSRSHTHPLHTQNSTCRSLTCRSLNFTF